MIFVGGEISGVEYMVERYSFIRKVFLSIVTLFYILLVGGIIKGIYRLFMKEVYLSINKRSQ